MTVNFWYAGKLGTHTNLNAAMFAGFADSYSDLPTASITYLNCCVYVTGVGIYQCQYSGSSYSWVLLYA